MNHFNTIMFLKYQQKLFINRSTVFICAKVAKIFVENARDKVCRPSCWNVLRVNFTQREIGIARYCVFRSARTSYRAFDFRPVHPSTRNNFSWVHRWAVTLPSCLRCPSSRLFSESWWCQLSKFGRKYKYKGKYTDKYNTQTNTIHRQIQRHTQIKGKPMTPMMWYIFEN